jgi:hypothetical protein
MITTRNHPRVDCGKNFKRGLLGSTLIVLTLGCRSKLDVETKSGAPLSQPAVPPELPKLETQNPGSGPTGGNTGTGKSGPTIEEASGAAELTRQYFFAKDTIEIEIKRELIENARYLDVFNITRVNDPEVDRGLSLMENYEIPDNVDLPWPHGKGFVIENKGAIRIRFFQTHPEMRKKLFAGKNRIKLVARDGESLKTTEIELIIVSSKFFEFSNLVFIGGKPYGEASTPQGKFVLEGWFNTVDKVSVKDSTGKFTLMVGSMNQMHSF